MSKKDYIMIADVIKQNMARDPKNSRYFIDTVDFITDLIHIFEVDNKNFDRTKFISYLTKDNDLMFKIF